MSPKVIVKGNILKLCEKLLKEVDKPPKMADLGSLWLANYYERGITSFHYGAANT